MINKVTLLGHLGKDPELGEAQNVKFAKLSIATTENYKDTKGQWQKLTEWHNVLAWRALADTCEKFLQKGSLAYIEGKLKTRQWTDNNGVKRYNTDIIASTIKLLDSRDKKDKELEKEDMSDLFPD